MITSEDIAKRLYMKKRHWLRGEPDVFVVGKEKKFGKLIFRFPDPEIISFGIYIYNKDTIEAQAKLAVLNFSEIINNFYQKSQI